MPNRDLRPHPCRDTDGYWDGRCEVAQPSTDTDISTQTQFSTDVKHRLPLFAQIYIAAAPVYCSRLSVLPVERPGLARHLLFSWHEPS
jgi:hypothetical protein